MRYRITGSFSVVFALGLSISLMVAAGCGGDGTVRGAGSINVPRPDRTGAAGKTGGAPTKSASIPGLIR
jgi:hypothetical protein